jgi:hypothetical protein
MLDGGDREVRIERVVTYQDAVFSEVRPNGGEWRITAHESNAPEASQCRHGVSGVRWGHGPQRLPRVNIRQANGIGRVHVAKPQMKETYCGRPVNEDDWLTTSKEANCTACARAGAPTRPQAPRRGQ